MKNIILPILLLFACVVWAQQTIRYDYDAAGNRISRTLIVEELRSAKFTGTIGDEIPQDELSETNGALQTVQVYPNPTTGVVFVDVALLPEDGKATLTVFDTGGKIVTNHSHVETNNRVDFTNTPNGIYMLRLTVEGKSRVWKVIKK
ncbi:MAG: T9SS type A sorting domain-containing protein [Prevotellaceae bacterium]|jgi:PKD repeat protein|nr:T9SS type A sorting domain-containing protein [Prevotellaceae bacterium]